MIFLTDLGICRAKPKQSVYSLKDGRGLLLRVEPNGAKLWHFRFYWQGKQQRISFGSFPDVDLIMSISHLLLGILIKKYDIVCRVL